MVEGFLLDLTNSPFPAKRTLALNLMNPTLRILLSVCTLTAAAIPGFAGTRLYDSKDIKEVVQPVPTPTPCNWTGFYAGFHAGGQFGHSETHDFVTGRTFGYSESGFNGGVQFGYNFQWNRIVIGPEFDIGYMNLEGRGTEQRFSSVRGETDSDFYTTLRGRVGTQVDWHGCWLVYATGGAIGLNYTKRFHVEPNFFDTRGTDFNWGYTVGGGVERKIGPRWSVKVEYLYYALQDQSFGEPVGTIPLEFRAETRGHIIRAGLNYHF